MSNDHTIVFPWMLYGIRKGQGFGEDRMAPLWGAFPAPFGWNFPRLRSTMRVNNLQTNSDGDAGFLLQREENATPFVGQGVLIASSLMSFAAVAWSAADCPIELSSALKPHESLIPSRTATSPALPTRKLSCLESIFCVKFCAVTYKLMLIERSVGWRYASSFRFRGKKK